jgi:hypothetical protein
MNDALQIALAVITPVCSALGAFVAVRVNQEWHRKEIERAHKRIDQHDEHFKDIWTSKHI